MLAEVEEMLKKYKVTKIIIHYINLEYFLKYKYHYKKDRFRTKLLQQSEEFKRNVSELVNEFKTKGPFSSELKPEEV